MLKKSFLQHVKNRWKNDGTIPQMFPIYLNLLPKLQNGDN